MKKITKILISMAMLITLSNAEMFVGVDGGYDVHGVASSGYVDSSVYNGHYGSRMWTLSLNFGGEGLVNNYFGFRAFLEAGYAHAIHGGLKFANLGVNADSIINFVNSGSFSFGMLLGLGANYEVNVSDGSGSFPLYGRTGFTFGIGPNSRIDLTLKLPIVGWYLNGNPKNTNASLKFQLGYKVLF